MTEQGAFRVRPVLADDVPQVVALVREVLGEFGLRFGEGSTTDDALLLLPGSYEAQGGAFWVAVDEASTTILGTCGIALVEPRVFEVRKILHLRPATRGAGLGQRLLDECIAGAGARGGQRGVLDTTEAMSRAIRFYERNGFVRDDAQIRGQRCSRQMRPGALSRSHRMKEAAANREARPGPFSWIRRRRSFSYDPVHWLTANHREDGLSRLSADCARDPRGPRRSR